MADFIIHNHGTVWTIKAVTDEAKLFAEENFDVPDWAGTPDNFTADHRPANALCAQLQDDGFELEAA